MNIVFLDIDGVLNSLAWNKERPAKQEGIITDALAHWKRSVDPKCVERVNRICRESDAKIVISSSWRTMLTMAELSETLIEKGLTAKIVGRTPELTGNRWLEIMTWIDNTKSFSLTPITQFVVLDDDPMPPAAEPHFVRTKCEIGLTDADADKAILILTQGDTNGIRHLYR